MLHQFFFVFFNIVNCKKFFLTIRRIIFARFANNFNSTSFEKVFRFFQQSFYHLLFYVTRFSFVDVFIFFFWKNYSITNFFRRWKSFINKHFSTLRQIIIYFIFDFSFFKFFFCSFSFLIKFFHTRKILFFEIFDKFFDFLLFVKKFRYR